MIDEYGFRVVNASRSVDATYRDVHRLVLELENEGEPLPTERSHHARHT